MANQEWESPGPTKPAEITAPARPSRKQSVVFLVRSDVKKELERGKNRFEQGDCQAARHCYEAALELDPGCAIAYFYVGFTCHEAGDLDLAREYYLQAIDLDRKQSLFLEHLARLHFELEEYSVCLIRFQEAQSVGPLQPISHGLMGRAYYELERFCEAIGCLNQMLELETDTRLRLIAEYYLTLSFLRDGAMIPARKQAESILADPHTDRTVLSSLAEQFLGAGCLSMAATFLDQLEEDYGEAADRNHEVQSILERAEAPLSKLFTSDEEKLLHHLHFISQFGTDRIYRGMISLTETPSPMAREAIISYCRKFGYEVDPALLSRSLSAESIVQDAALLYLAETFDPQYLDLMISHFNHPAREVQHAVARYLERCGQLEHLSALEKRMERAEGASLRRQIQRAINQIKRRHTEQTDHLATKQAVPSYSLEPAASSKPKYWRHVHRLAIVLAFGYFVFRLVSSL